MIVRGLSIVNEYSIATSHAINQHHFDEDLIKSLQISFISMVV